VVCTTFEREEKQGNRATVLVTERAVRCDVTNPEITKSEKLMDGCLKILKGGGKIKVNVLSEGTKSGGGSLWTRSGDITWLAEGGRSRVRSNITRKKLICPGPTWKEKIKRENDHVGS